MYANLTDSELLSRLRTANALTPLEMELAARLERALDALDDAIEEVPAGARHQNDA